MDLNQEVRKAWTLFRITLRYLLTTPRGIATIALGIVPLLVVVGVALGNPTAMSTDLLELLAVPLFIQVVLVFVTLVQASALIRDEIDDQTLPYLLTRPLSKPGIVLYKYLGYFVAALVVLVPSVVLAFFVAGGYTASPLQWDLLGALVTATALGALAYGAFFTLLSVVTRRPLIVGLLFGFIWEFGVGSVPGDVPKLSLVFYLRSVLKGMISRGPLTDVSPYVSAPVAIGVLVLFSVVALIVAVFVFQASEFRQKG